MVLDFIRDGPNNRFLGLGLGLELGLEWWWTLLGDGRTYFNNPAALGLGLGLGLEWWWTLLGDGRTYFNNPAATVYRQIVS